LLSMCKSLGFARGMFPVKLVECGSAGGFGAGQDKLVDGQHQPG